ncbi:MAG: hypothetical protein EHM42_11840, partial [Planctomycetaceae bacterium]
MIRHLMPLCLLAALCGCTDTAAPPAKTAGGSAGSAATPPISQPSASGREVAKANGAPANSASSAKAAGEQTASTAEPAPAGPSKPEPVVETKQPEPAHEPASEPKTAQDETAPTEPAVIEDKGPKTVDEAIAKLQRARSPEAIEETGAILEALLEKEPDHSEGLVTMAQVAQF